MKRYWEICIEAIRESQELEKSGICDLILREEEALATDGIDKEKENNLDMDNNSVMVKIVSNLLYHKNQVQLYKNMSDPIKQPYLIFLKPKVSCIFLVIISCLNDKF
jgi:hypothetical protein